MKSRTFQRNIASDATGLLAIPLFIFLIFGMFFLPANASLAAPPEFTPLPTDVVFDTQTKSFTFLVFDPTDDKVQVTVTGLPPGFQLNPLGWKVTTVAGNLANSFKDGPALSASFYAPYDVALDGAGNIIVADTWNNRIRKIDSLGNVSTIAGTGQPGSLDGPALSATFSHPTGLAIDSQGNIFIADNAANKIRRLDKNGIVSTFAGTGSAGFLDGPGSNAEFNSPWDIELDASGNLIVSDEYNRAVRRIDQNGNVTTLAGTGVQGNKDGPSNIAEFKEIYGIGIGPFGEIYVADPYNKSIRMITNNNVSTVYNSNAPRDIAIDNLGNTFFSYYYYTYLYNGTAIQSLNGQNPGTFFNFNILGDISGIAIDPRRNLFLANNQANIIQKISGPYYEISGTYTGDKCGGDFPVTIRATDSNGEYTDVSFTITIPRQVPDIMCLENLSDILDNPVSPSGVLSEGGNVRDILTKDNGEVIETPSVVTGTIGIDPNDPRIVGQVDLGKIVRDPSVVPGTTGGDPTDPRIIGQIDSIVMERDPGLVLHNPGGIGVPATPANLTISKDIGACDAAGTCTYIITVENTGGSPFYGPIIVEDTFIVGAAGMLAGYSGQTGTTCQYNSPTVTCLFMNPPSLKPFNPGDKQIFTLHFGKLNLGGEMPKLENCAQFSDQMLWLQHRLMEALVAKGYTFTSWSFEELEAALKDYAVKNGLPFGHESAAASLNDMGGYKPVTESLLGPNFVWDPDLLNEPQDDPTDNKDCASFQPPSRPVAAFDFAIIKKAKNSGSGWLPGGQYQYNITVTNVGNASATAPNTIYVMDNLPPWFIPSSAKGTFWNCTISGQTVSCQVPLSLPVAPGASLPKIKILGTLSRAATRTMENCATVSSSTPDNNPSNDQGCVTVKIQ